MTNPNDSTVLSLKTKKQVKELAQMRAKQLGIPLGTLVNAFLRDLGQTGEVHFTISEPVTPKMAKIIEEMRAEVARGETYGPFDLGEAEAFLGNIPHEQPLKIEYSRKFRKQFARLDTKTRNQFKRRQRLWLKNPYHPQLHLHMLSGEYVGFYSINITGDLRALYQKIGDSYVIFGFIGTHSQLYK
ncbi:MAG: type II toxin-antitoxin system mRNA interferase toxin, RelE/StbE family [Candidatus Saccharimonadales bacterium]